MRSSVAAGVAIALLAISARAAADEKRVKGLFEPNRIEASSDGRAWLVSSDGHALVIDGDTITKGPAEPPWTEEPASPGTTCETEVVLEKNDHALRCGGTAMPDEKLLHALGPKSIRLALARDAASNRYALLRSGRWTNGTATDEDRRSIAIFRGGDRDVEKELLTPNLAAAETATIAFRGGHLWVGFSYGVHHWNGSTWTTYADDKSAKEIASAAAEERKHAAIAISTGLGSVAALSLPISLVSKDRYVPVSTITLVGTAPAFISFALLDYGVRGDAGPGPWNALFRAASFIGGAATLPLVGLTTYGMGEGFGGPNASRNAASVGAQVGGAVGAVVWLAATRLIFGPATESDWIVSLPLGAAVLSASSTTGYLWAGRGLRRN